MTHFRHVPYGGALHRILMSKNQICASDIELVNEKLAATYNGNGSCSTIYFILLSSNIAPLLRKFSLIVSCICDYSTLTASINFNTKGGSNQSEAQADEHSRNKEIRGKWDNVHEEQFTPYFIGDNRHAIIASTGHVEVPCIILEAFKSLFSSISSTLVAQKPQKSKQKYRWFNHACTADNKNLKSALCNCPCSKDEITAASWIYKEALAIRKAEIRPKAWEDLDGNENFKGQHSLLESRQSPFFLTMKG